MFLRTAHLIYVQLPEALGLAIRLGDKAHIRQDFNAPANPYTVETIFKTVQILVDVTDDLWVPDTPDASAGGHCSRHRTSNGGVHTVSD